MPRLFVAIDTPEPVRQRLAGLGGGIPGARWTPPEQFHLTLRFIGEVADATLDDIAEALAMVDLAPFSIRLKGVGHFPPRGSPRVLWAGVEDATTAARLHDRIEARLRRLGLPPDDRRFAAHITLARLRNAPIGRVKEFLAGHAMFESEPFAVAEFHLYSSRLGPKGAIHRIEASYELGGESD